MVKSLLKKPALFAASILVSSVGFAQSAQAVVVDFNGESTGSKSNGYTVGGITFTDTVGSGLTVDSYAESQFSNALAVFGDDVSQLRMVFGGAATDLSFSFGNDEVCVPGNCTFNADRAILELYISGTQVASTFVLFNQNNINDQTIGINGVNFDEALFYYGSPNGGPGNLIEVIDNISYQIGAAVPEPSAWALMILGFGLVGGAMRGSRRQRTSLTFG